MNRIQWFKDESIEINGTKAYWHRRQIYQGCSYIFLSNRKHARFPDYRKDYIVAYVRRNQKPVINDPDLLQICPFEDFGDGLYAGDGVISPKIVNQNPTKISL